MKTANTSGSGQKVTHIAPSTAFVEALDIADFSLLNESDLGDRLAILRKVERSVAAALVSVVARAEVLVEQGKIDSVERFMSGKGEVSRRQVRKETARSEVVQKLDSVGVDVSATAMSVENLDALGRHTDGLSTEVLQDVGKKLVEQASVSPVDSFDQTARKTVQAAKGSELEDYAQLEAASSVKHWFDQNTKMGHIHATFDPIRYEKLAKKLDKATTALANKRHNGKSGNVKKDPNLAAAALFDLIDSPSADEQAQEPNRRRPEAEILVVVDAETLKAGPHADSICETETGEPIPVETIDRLACDGLYRKVVTDNTGVPISVGRQRRTANAAQWAATKATHSTCAWDECQTRIGCCQLHHIVEWENGGPTNLPNMVPLCIAHHHKVHEGKWKIIKNQDGSLSHLKPDGTEHRTIPPPTRNKAGP